MFSDTDRGVGSTTLRFVTCDLSSLSDSTCCCVTAGISSTGSSSKRKVRSKPSPFLDPENLTPTTAKRIILERPSVVDRLISENRTALEEMEGRRSAAKLQAVKPKAKTSTKEAVKRKRVDSLSNGTSPTIKRLRSSKGGSESDSSSSRNASTERKRSTPNDKTGKTSCPPGNKQHDKRPNNKASVDDKNAPAPKKIRKSAKSRFSKRICFSTSSLRSGKKRTELLKRKRIVKALSKDKTKRVSNDKTDTNSNVCTENDSNDETVDNSTDSEISRSASDFIDNKEKDKNQEEDAKKKKKRRKRDSMWVKKVKKQLKGKSEITTDKSLPPPSLKPFHEIKDRKSSDVLEELPILDKESDNSIKISDGINSASLNPASLDDVPMPMLEKEVETPLVSELSCVNSIISTKEVTVDIMNSLSVDNMPSDVSKKSDENILKIEVENMDEILSENVSTVCEIDTSVEVTVYDEDKPSKYIEKPVLAQVAVHVGSKSKDMESISEFTDKKSNPLESSEKEIPIECSLSNKEEKVELSSSDKHSISSDERVFENEFAKESFPLKDDLCCPQQENDLPTSLNENGFSHEPIGLETQCADTEVQNNHCDIPVIINDACQPVSLLEKENICDSGAVDISSPKLNGNLISKSIYVPENQIVKPNDVNCNSENLTINSHNFGTTSTHSNDLQEPKTSVILCDQIKEETEDIVKQQPENTDIFKENFVSSAQNLEEEMTKLEEVLSKNSETEFRFSEAVKKGEADVEVEETKCSDVLEGDVNHKTDTGEITICESNIQKVDTLDDSKNVSLLDADSTSDMKPSTLDDSFGDFSLSLPEDLELGNAQSDEEKEGEMAVLPDSTDCGQSDEPNIEVCPCQEDTLNVPPNEEENPFQIQHETSDNTFLTDVAKASEMEDAVSNGTTLCMNELPKEEPLAVSTPAISTEEAEKDEKIPEIKKEELTVEQRQMKESVLQALGLKSLSAVSSHPPAEEKPKRDGYTGTLKAVIKLNRSGDKKRMVYQRTEDSLGELEYRICSEIPSTEGVPITHLNDIAGIRKNISKLNSGIDTNIGTAVGNGLSDDHESSHDESKNTSGKDLIIPEKSSSFSIHPGRLCSDVCTYCFGKFGCLDTPCHVAALKAERQKKILENEPHLTAESCLCDACYRYVDRKANCPSKSSSGGSGKPRVKPPASSQCCVNLCQEQATHTVKKKWLVKLKKSITNKLDIDLDKPGAMYFPLCAQHHYWVDYFTVCGICRKRLNRNHLYSLGSETDRLNLMLAEDGIPARLSDKLFLCKLCRYYSNLRLKYSDPSSIPPSSQIFYRDYRRKILTSLDIPVSDSEDEHSLKDDKKKPSGVKNISSDDNLKSNGASTSNKSDDSVRALSNLATLLGEQPEQQARIQVKFGNVNIGRLSNLNIGQGGREERLPYSDVGLQASLEFEGPVVPDGSWERCVSTIQFDKRTKKLWQDLQKPYGNQSSFLRHLVMLEKYWRAGHLTLTSNADERVTKYLNGVKNRIKAFEGSSSSSAEKQSTVIPPTSSPVPSVSSNEKFPLITNTGEIEVTPISIVQKRPSTGPLQTDKKLLTPLDRAKALVRMVPPSPRQRFPLPIQRYHQLPVYVPNYNYPSPSNPPRPPPLLKIRNKGVPMAAPFYQQALRAPGLPLKPILPKLPSALTVTQVSQGGAAITLNRSGITIEKQSGINPVTPSLPIEKPSISVFREPAPGPP